MTWMRPCGVSALRWAVVVIPDDCNSITRHRSGAAKTNAGRGIERHATPLRLIWVSCLHDPSPWPRAFPGSSRRCRGRRRSGGQGDDAACPLRLGPAGRSRGREGSRWSRPERPRGGAGCRRTACGFQSRNGRWPRAGGRCAWRDVLGSGLTWPVRSGHVPKKRLTSRLSVNGSDRRYANDGPTDPTVVRSPQMAPAASSYSPRLNCRHPVYQRVRDDVLAHSRGICRECGRQLCCGSAPLRPPLPACACRDGRRPDRPLCCLRLPHDHGPSGLATARVGGRPGRFPKGAGKKKKRLRHRWEPGASLHARQEAGMCSMTSSSSSEGRAPRPETILRGPLRRKRYDT